MKIQLFAFLGLMALISFRSATSAASQRDLLKCEAPSQTTWNRFSGTASVEVDDFNQVSAILNMNLFAAGSFYKTAIQAEIEGEFEFIPEGILAKSEVNIYTLSNPIEAAPRLALKILQGPDLQILSSLMIDGVRYVSYCRL